MELFVTNVCFAAVFQTLVGTKKMGEAVLQILEASAPALAL